MIYIKLDDEQQATVLLNLVNIAVKTAGLEAAEAGLFFKSRIDAGVAAAKSNEVNIETE